MFLTASGITDAKRKRALLLYQAGPGVREIFKQLTDTGNDDDYEVAKAKLKEYFDPQKNRQYEVYRFRQAMQNPDETLDEYHTRLRTMSATCEFNDVELNKKGQTCRTCGKTNHFARVCQSKTKQVTQKKRRYHKGRGKPIHPLQHNNSDNSDEDYLYAVNKDQENTAKVKVKVCGASFMMTLDTGATINVIMPCGHSGVENSGLIPSVLKYCL